MFPTLYINIQMNGKVKGLPTKVPISEAIMLPLKIYAKITASKK